MKFSIYPTNKSWSYKVLSHLNWIFFDVGVPKNVCGYFWLSVFYGLVAINLLAMTITTFEFLSAEYLGTDVILANIFVESMFLLVSIGAVLGFYAAIFIWIIISCTVFVVMYLILPIAVCLFIIYPFFNDEVDKTNIKSFVVSFLHAVCYAATDNKLTKGLAPCLTYLWKLTRFIKCKKLNFEEK